MIMNGWMDGWINSKCNGSNLLTHDVAVILMKLFRHI